MKKGSWNALDCVVLVRRALESDGTQYEGAACGVAFLFRKEANDRWIVEDARPVNGRWSKSKNNVCALVHSTLRIEQGE